MGGDWEMAVWMVESNREQARLGAPGWGALQELWGQPALDILAVLHDWKSRSPSPAGLAPKSLPLPLDWIPFPSPVYFENRQPPASTLLPKCNLMLRKPSVYSSSSTVNGYLRSTCKNPTPRKLSSWTLWERPNTRKFKKSRISSSRGLPSLTLTRKPGK